MTTQDLHTQENTRDLHDALCELYGACPASVINLLHRIKLDANRDIGEAAFGVPEAEDAWHAYMDSLEDARDQLGGFALYLDIHGHGHPNDWVELGYLISGSNLDSGNFEQGDTSIVNLGDITSVEFDQLLRGENSFGDLLGQEGYWSVPSPTDPGPDGESYFSGGYITQRFGSRDGGPTDCIQIESPRVFREDSENYMNAIARVVGDYLDAHHPDWRP